MKERCRQLIGISDCVMHLTGTRPRVLSLKCEKYALKEEGDYGIVSYLSVCQYILEIANRTNKELTKFWSL